MEYCRKTLESKGYEVEVVGSTLLRFKHGGHVVEHYPYSGWHTGRSITDGRGFMNLLKQLK